MTRESILRRFFIISMFTAVAASTTFAQGNGFNFQGRLNDGTNPASGQYDMQFRLYNAITGGAQIGSTLARPATVLINGVFSTTPDFGAAAFNNPNSIFIEIGVKPANSPNAYTILGPRQQLTVVPFAVRANNATNADFAINSANAQIAVNATNATTATNALSLDGVTASGYAKLNVINTGDLRTTGALAITGDASQPITSNGFVKAMVYVNADGSILRCYNGITNSSSGNCGFTISGGGGSLRIDFGFRVFDRFVAVTTVTAASVTIVPSFKFIIPLPNTIDVNTNITDVDHIDSFTPNPFMLIVY